MVRMPLVVDATPDPNQALLDRIAELERFVALIRAEYDEPGHVTKDEIRAALDSLT
jgi:hypothetical protein